MKKYCAPVILACFLVSCAAHAKAPGLATAHSRVESALPTTVEHYKWFHQNPELSYQEVNTAKHIAQALRDMGFEVHEGVGKTGLVGVLKSTRNPRSKIVLYRADMDALPVAERTGLAYASTNPGVMHACGHDVHMSVALGTLKILSEMRNQWQGTIVFVGQPAEELGTGARTMLADPAFNKILEDVGQPRVALALHDSADLPAGHVALAPGYVNANVDSVDITVFGTGGHGAQPHQTVDPIVIGANIVTTLQTIVSRRLSPTEPAVVTVGMFQGGSKHNIIPPEAKLLLTVRSYGDETRAHLIEEIKRVAVNTAAAHGAPKAPEVVVREEGTAAAYNDPEWTERLRGVFASVLGEGQVHGQKASMGGEDFGEFSRTLKIPAVMYRLGATNAKLFAQKNGDVPGLHSDLYAPDPDPTLRTGLRTMTAAILEALR